MVSLWRAKKPTNEEEQHEEGDQQNEAAASQADERTRLISRPSGGYLDPDDPAVSPYNLWSIRALRLLSIFFLAITFFWWVLLFVSIFVSPPGLHSRGSGFFDVSFTTLTLGNLVVGILFFIVPSMALEISNIVLAVILFVDMVVILAVSGLRHEESAPGIAAVVWAFFIAVYGVIADRAVAWGKREEEERLTGRAENRRSLREYCAMLTYTIINIVLIIVAILMTGTIGLRARDSTLGMPGKRYDVEGGKYAVHLACVGNLTYSDKIDATVLIEAGENPFEDTMAEFIQGAYEEGVIARYCYWDRPGIAFSDNAPSPHSAGMSADALSSALVEAGEEGPWVLLSAGIGSLYSRIFSSRHVGDVKALMLIDPLSEDYLPEIGSAEKGFKLWIRGFISPLGLDRLPAAIFKGRNREDRVYGRSAYQTGKFIKAQLQENLVANSLTRGEISNARTIQMKDTPLVVVTSGEKIKEDSKWEKRQEKLTKITDNLFAWDVVKEAPHEVWRSAQGRAKLTKRLKQLVKKQKA